MRHRNDDRGGLPVAVVWTRKLPPVAAGGEVCTAPGGVPLQAAKVATASKAAGIEPVLSGVRSIILLGEAAEPNPLSLRER